MRTPIIYTLLFAALLSMSLSASAQYIKGEGSIVSEEFSLEEFDRIGVAIPCKVSITQGKQQKVVVKGQKNILDNIKRKVKGGFWEISFKKNTRKFDPVRIEITVSNLQELTLAGSGSVKTNNTIQTDGNFELSISGSGNADIQVEAQDIACSVSGSGSLHLSGRANNLDASLAGSGSISAYDMKVNNCQVSTVGSGSAKVHVRDNIEASMVGSGNVLYKGDPKVDASVIGSGKVRKAN